MFFVTCGDMQAGFQITLDNGWIVSIMFGSFAYSSNHMGWKPDCFNWDNECKSAEARATSAEVWAFHNEYDRDKEHLLPTEKDSKNYYLANHYPENPLGYQNTTEVFNFIKHVSNLPLPSLRIMGLEARKKEETDG